MTVTLLEHPTEKDWIEVKRRAMVTIGKDTFKSPDMTWKHAILNARHSPIRYLRFSFYIELKYWVACELRTHVHDMPYVSDFDVYIKSQRNDRQCYYDRNAARQDAPVNMIIDINGEQIQILANKRLCAQATKEARDVVKEMCRLVLEQCPEFDGLLVPMCEYHGGVCHEMKLCGKLLSKNEPITKEQLTIYRKQHKPVWAIATCIVGNPSGWALAGDRNTISQDFCNTALWYETYGIEWIAYEKPCEKFKEE